MKILLATPDSIDKVGDRFFSNMVSIFLLRYKAIGNEFVIANPIREVITTKSDEISEHQIEYIALEKVNTLKGLILTSRKNKSRVFKAVKEADLVIAHVPSFNGELVAKIGHKLGKKVVCVVMACPWDSYWNYNFKGKLIAPFRYWSLKRLAKRSKSVIYVTKKFLQSRYPTDGHSLACSNVQIKTGEKSVLENRLTSINNRVLLNSPILKIATIAAIDVPFKGQKYVMEALYLLKQKGLIFNYYLIGGGDNTILKQYAEHLDISDQVIFEGVIPHTAIPTYLDSIDIYIQPSKQEGLPRSVIEAMSRGCYCLGSDVAGIPELLDSSCLFKKGSSIEIARLLSEISLDRLREYATINFEKAMEYDQTILDKKRTAFLKDILSK